MLKPVLLYLNKHKNTDYRTQGDYTLEGLGTVLYAYMGSRRDSGIWVHCWQLHVEPLSGPLYSPRVYWETEDPGFTDMDANDVLSNYTAAGRQELARALGLEARRTNYPNGG